MLIFQVDVVLRDTNHAITETVNCEGSEPLTWTDRDVEWVLRRILLSIHRAKHPSGDEDQPCSA